MIVGEGGADGLFDLKTPTFCNEPNFRRRERIVFCEFEDSKVESSSKILLKRMETEVEGKRLCASNKSLRNGVF